MHRKPFHRWIAVLALVATLGVLGAQPAAAADLSGLRVADRLAVLWPALYAGPAALWESLIGWLGGSATEKSASPDTTEDPPLNESGTFGMDPNGGS